jgi:hypothetical protein
MPISARATLKQFARGSLNAVVRAEAALLDRPPASLDAVGTPIVVASHRRSGTHLTLDLLRRNFPACRPRMLPLESPHNAYFSIDRFFPDAPLPASQREALRLLAKAERPTIKTHAEPDFHEIAPRHRDFADRILQRSVRIYVWRDGRKVLCSLWTWRQGFDPAARVPFVEFLRQRDERGRSRPRVWAEHVAAWRRTPGVFSLQFERLVRETDAVLAEIAGLISETPARADPPLPPANTTSADSLRARLRGDLTSTNVHSEGRTPPKPADIFTADDEAFFQDETKETLAEVDRDEKSSAAATLP